MSATKEFLAKIDAHEDRVRLYLTVFPTDSRADAEAKIRAFDKHIEDRKQFCASLQAKWESKKFNKRKR